MPNQLLFTPGNESFLIGADMGAAYRADGVYKTVIPLENLLLPPSAFNTIRSAKHFFHCVIYHIH